MDGHRFDDLARAAAGSQSRRALLKRLVATAAGGVLTSLLPARSVLAQECVVTCTDPYVLDPATCQCVCGPDTTPTFNSVCCPNANVCGNACLVTPCDASACQVCDPDAFGPGLGTCVSACTDAHVCLNDGTCGCDPATACTSPYVVDPVTCDCVCGPNGTPTFNITCCPNANVCGDACMGTPCEDLPCHVCDPNGRGEGLGACVSACTDNQTCQSGTCVGAKCPKGQAECGGVCITTSSDPANCGGCGKLCQAGQVCQSGKCV